MAYFNHAFQKTFVGTAGFNPEGLSGKLGTPGNILEGGQFAFVDAKNWQLLPTDEEPKCPLVLASGSIYQKDKIGPFHGGYLESNKSKTINPKYVSKFYRVDPCQPQNEIVHLGSTAYTNENPGCCKKFYCGETYTLRVDVKGSPALRLLNHNSYIIASAYGGCCPEGAIAPVEIDSTLIFIQWAEAIVRYPVISPFLLPIVIDQAGDRWYAPGTDAAWLAVNGGDTWDNYVSEGYEEGACAGLVLVGAYVDTKFENCTFQLTDFYEIEPVRIYASEVDLNGDPCLFNQLCVVKECEGRQAMGLGESVARDLILSEQYRQNFFHSDFRIREITQGYSVFDYINRNNLYTRYYLLHNVPRFNNPTSTFDNDQYLLEIITDGEIVEFQNFVNGWLSSTGSDCVELEEESCVTACEPTYNYPGCNNCPAV
jgi:hypothetical protein